MSWSVVANISRPTGTIIFLSTVSMLFSVIHLTFHFDEMKWESRGCLVLAKSVVWLRQKSFAAWLGVVF